MGFTPLEGLVMATRAGDVDPGIVLWLVQGGGLDASDVAEGLERRSGLLGLSGRSADMRDVVAAVDEGDDRARLAYDVWVHRLRAAIAGMASTMDGFDALVFTAGIGEGGTRPRADACAGLGFLGVVVDRDANAAASGDADISAPDARAGTLVVTSREDRQIAAEVRRVLG